MRKVVPKTVKIHLLKMKVRHQGKRWAAYKFVFKAVAHPDLELRWGCVACPASFSSFCNFVNQNK